MKDDIGRVMHSSVAIGTLSTTFVAVFLTLINQPYLIILWPLVLPLLKEIRDYIVHKIFSIQDIKDTLNPLIAIKWYKKITK